LKRELKAIGVAPAGDLSPIGSLRHTITHHRILVEIFVAQARRIAAGTRRSERAGTGREIEREVSDLRRSKATPGAQLAGGFPEAATRWVAPDRAGELPLTGIARKILRVLAGASPPAAPAAPVRISRRPANSKGGGG
jgi:hypothetical protein